MKVLILMGLPGSGKTTFAKQQSEAEKNINLHKLCVSIGTSHESDYYGGKGSNYAFYQCNVQVLYDGLISRGIMGT